MIVYYDNHFTHEDLIKKEIKNERYKVFNRDDFKAYVDQIKDERDEEVKIISVFTRPDWLDTTSGWWYPK